MRMILAALSSLALAACGLSGQDNERTEEKGAAKAPANNEYGYATYGENNLADSMASNDAASGEAPDIPDSQERPVMQAQVVLDRLGFGPGVIDGKMGMSTKNALTGFQMANDLEVTGELDSATERALAEWERIPATRVVTIPQAWGRGTYPDIPEEPEAQAKMERLGYNSLDERLAERFHTTIETLRMLNPGGRPAGAQGEVSENPEETEDPGSDGVFRAGQVVRVPNIGGDRIVPGSIDDPTWQRTLASLGVGSEQPDVARIVVSKSEGTLMAYDEQDNLVALFTVTSGSERDPLPLGEWDILGVAHNPPFSYDPDLFWDVPDTEEELQLPPGPNGPVGVVWIDLSKDHYGLHGTSEPQTIGRVQSHGCVRLTNWDAARLSEMVSQSTEVIFEA